MGNQVKQTARGVLLPHLTPFAVGKKMAISKTFKPSVHNFDRTGTNTAKNVVFLVLYRLY